MTFTMWRRFLLILALLGITAAVNAEIIDVSCVYETAEKDLSETAGHSHHAQKQPVKWFFWRANKAVEVSNASQSFGEKWTINGNRNVFYQALYHEKRFLLDFQPADLKILGKQSDWEIRSTVFPKKILKQLTQKQSGTFSGYKTVRYEGKVAGTHYIVDWLPELNLPASVSKTEFNKQVVTKLKEVYPLKKSPYKQKIVEGYDDMDYADIGDNESHPVVAQLQKNTGVGYFHQH